MIESTLEDDILDVLCGTPSLTARDLAARVKERRPYIGRASVMEAVLPLVSAGRIELTEDRKLRLRPRGGR